MRMGLKPTSLAGWCLFVLLLFLSAFYVVSGHLLSMPGAWGPRFSIALTESVAFFGGAVLLRFLAKDRKLNRRLRPVSRVYTSFALLTAVTAALGLFLLNVGLARTSYASLTGARRPLPNALPHGGRARGAGDRDARCHPALVQEVFLRGALFSLFEKQGTAAALVLSTISMPMLYVYPSAAPLVLVDRLFVRARDVLHELRLAGGAHASALPPGAIRRGPALCLRRARGTHGDRGRRGGRALPAVPFSLLRSCEGALRDGLLARFQKGRSAWLKNLWASFGTLGFLLFLLLYITRLVMILLGMWR